MTQLTPDLVGRTLVGRYDLLALLGRGGMGAVYRAYDRTLDEAVALKVISGELAHRAEGIERFRHEVKLARRVTHRNVARTFELGHDGPIMFCTMELVEGHSLRHRLATEGKLSVADATAIACALCDGLAAAHAADVIHRDIKPDNVLLATDGRVVLADFGVAVAGIRGTDDIVGTPAYMAPEQATGEPATPAADVYAVGVVLFEMLSGTRAFTGGVERIDAVKREQSSLPIPAAANIAPELAFIIGRATARDRGERFATATELRDALEPWVRVGRSLAPRSLTSPAGLEMSNVVVLPATGDDRQLHVAQVIHDMLIDRLARLPRIRVLPRMAVSDADRASTIVELAAREELHVTIRCPDAAPTELWLSLAIEDVERSVDTAAVAIGAAIVRTPRVYGADEVEALDLLFRARKIIGSDLSEFQRAAGFLERADQLCPDEPRIMAALAAAQLRQAFFSNDASAERLERSAALIAAALAAGPELVGAHLAAGQLALHLGHSARAASHFRTAIACAPHAAEAHDYLGRMLLEAGYLDVGRARLEDARASIPDIANGYWDLARAQALEGQWDEADRVIARLVAVSGERVIPLARHAWWRGDRATLVAMRAKYDTSKRPFDGAMMEGAFASILDGAWADWRDRLVALAIQPIASQRRVAFFCQMVAEIAAMGGDRETSLDMIARAINAGLFDLHWLERCPVLAPVRAAPRYAQLHGRIKRRAVAILDALYGDHDSGDLSDTVAG